jgi:3-(3-hydroxy-phenyl)propionate hydroxylase
VQATEYKAAAHTNSYEFTQGSGYQLPEYPFVPPPELGKATRRRHPIVIVGGGITGLTLACSLARLGVPAVLLDEDNTVGVKGASSRGICYTQKSLEIFQRLGIYERIAAKGIRWSVGRTFAGHDEVYSFDLRQQGGYNLSQQPPFINIQQFYIEGFLVERIAELGPRRAALAEPVTVAFEQNADVATLTVETPAGRYTIEADHVIDATGSNSPLRKWLQVPFTSKRGDDRWCIADVRFTKRPPIERHTWVEAPFNEHRAVWQHLMADDVWRIDYQMAPDSDPAHVSREDVVRERLARQFGPDTEVEIVWVGPYAYRSECVHRMREGRVFFMGDSAKVVSPFGARGGNTGVADADNLAWKLAAVWRGRAHPALLESYGDERLEAAQQNVLVTNRTARFLRPADGVERLFRRAAIGLAKQHPFARTLMNTGRMAVANPYSHSRVCSYAEGSAAGQSVQNVALRWADGSAGCVNDLLNWAGRPVAAGLRAAGPAAAGSA